MSRSTSTCLILTLCAAIGCVSPGGSTDTAQSTSAAAAAAARVPLVPGSGTYSRPISATSPESQAYFDQGLRFAWGFFFPESIASYQAASRLSPSHPMPYWGLAHAMGPNPNSRYGRMPDDPLGEGLKAITKARALVENASALEAELINALWILYDKVSIQDDHQRDIAYLAAARALNEKYPEDADIAALYAAAYMCIGRWDYWDADGNPKSETAEVARALDAALAITPGHPGANHLYIHLLEASLEPEKALAAADRLESTMPIAGHVVHMPAHIYVRVGQYAKAIANNVRSQAADKKLAKIWGDAPLPNLGTYPLSHKMHAPHAIDFIRYAATVQGNYEIAISAANQAAAHINQENVDMRGGQKRISAPWMVNKIFGKWQLLLDHEPQYLGRPYLDGMWSYAKGSALAATGDLEGARMESQKLSTLANSPNADEFRVGATPASAVLKLSSLLLAAEISQASGDLPGAIASFTAAVEIEDQNNYTEPPDWSQPVRHYLGAALLEHGLAARAEEVYRRDLRWNQNNGWSLFGLHQSLIAQGETEEAAQVFEAYERAWKNADTEITRSRI
jgi:tetratricopeptide (TPR) repeat protein